MKSFIDFQKEETELDEEQLDEARGKVVASYIQKAKEAMKKKIDMKRKTAQLNDPNSAEKKIVKESDLDEEQLDEDTKYTPRFEYRQKVQPNIDKHLDDRKTAGAHTAITYHKQSDGSTHAKVQYRNISHTNSSGVGPIQHKHFSVNKDHSVTPIKINEEQLDELSKDTLASYEKKSRVAAHKHALASELKGLAADPAGSYAHKMMADKRHAGWKVAVKKLNTEEVEQIDELSKDTLASYVNKSAKDVGERSHRPDHVKRLKGISVAVNKLSGYQHRDIELPTRKGNHLNRGDSEEEDSNDPRHDARNIDPSKLTKKSDLGSYVNKAAREISGTSYRPNHAEYLQGIRTAVKKLHTEESDTPFEGPYKQSKGTVTDKSGAKHTPLSNVRSLARNAIEKMKQKMRMAHLSPEVRAEKLARNEELVGGQKKLDIDKDGKIEKSDLEVLRAKKLKEDVTTAAQKLKAALDRHTENAVAANRAGDHDAVKVHQEYANKIKTKLGKLAKNEETEISEVTQRVRHSEWEDIVKQEHPDVELIQNMNQHGTHISTHAIAKGKWGGEKVGQYTMNTGIGTFKASKPANKKIVKEEVEIDEDIKTRKQLVSDVKKASTASWNARVAAGNALDAWHASGHDDASTAAHHKARDAREVALAHREAADSALYAHDQQRKSGKVSVHLGAKSGRLTKEELDLDEEQLDEISGKTLGSYIQKARSDMAKTRTHARELASDPKVQKLHAKLADYYDRREYTKSGDSKYRKAINKTSDDITKAKQKIDPDYPKSTWTMHRSKGIENAVSKLTRGKLTNNEEVDLDEEVEISTKKSFKDFTAEYGDRAKEVMYATKRAVEEEVELEEDMDEGVTTHVNGITVHKGTYGTSYQPNDDEDDEDTPEKKDPAVKRGRGRPAGAKSGAKTKGSSAGKSYGGLAIHSLRLPNNNK